MQHKLNPAFIAKAKPAPGAERTLYWDSALPGFGLMTTANGHKSYVVQYRAGRVSRRMTLKANLSLAEARREAKGIMGAVAKGGDPLQEAREARAAEANTLAAVAAEYLTREARNLGKRTLAGKKFTFRRYVFPRLGQRPIDAIKRSEIVRLLDRIEDDHGPTAAHHALAALRRLMSWHAARDDDFKSPIVHGMGRIKPKERARQRILTDDELRSVWKAAEAPGPFPALVKLLLLTAARRTEAAAMTWDEFDGTDWALPASRNKAKFELVRPLSKAAQDVLSSLPRINNCRFVFSTNGRTPISGYSKFKATFDKMCGVTGWTLHDLRRTARSLMSRAGVDADHAERALGHVVPGVRGVYDRHSFYEEKQRAFNALAAQIECIVNPPEGVVTPLRGRERP
jgi:integrase